MKYRFAIYKSVRRNFVWSVVCPAVAVRSLSNSAELYATEIKQNVWKLIEKLFDSNATTTKLVGYFPKKSVV